MPHQPPAPESRLGEQVGDGEHGAAPAQPPLMVLRAATPRALPEPGCSSTALYSCRGGSRGLIVPLLEVLRCGTVIQRPGVSPLPDPSPPRAPRASTKIPAIRENCFSAHSVPVRSGCLPPRGRAGGTAAALNHAVARPGAMGKAETPATEQQARPTGSDTTPGDPSGSCSPLPTLGARPSP